MPGPAKPHRDVIVLAIDGLRASALGAYGFTGRPTPALDHLACASVLCETTFAQTSDPHALYRAPIGEGVAWAARRLVTDHAGVALMPAFANFNDATVVSPGAAAYPAASVGDTWLACCFAALAEATGPDAPGSSDRGPTLTWFHTTGLAAPWDAPPGLIAEGVDIGEDDPVPAADVSPAAGAVDREADPDAIFVAACRYNAQVAVLDGCLGDWLGVLTRLYATPPAIVLLAPRGYPLGEHGRLGYPEAGPYSESRHVPLLVQTPGIGPGLRYSERLVGLDEALQLLPALAAGGAAYRAAAELGRHALPLQGARTEAIRTPGWLLIRDRAADGHALYAKPDDRWEVNDVASLAPDVCDSLRGQMRGPLGAYFPPA